MYELEKETYLGNTRNIFTSGLGISVVETEYKEKVYEGWHSHNTAHLTYFLKGGTTEKRKSGSETLGPGSLLFYHSDELHLNKNTLFPSRNINIEVEDDFLKVLQLSEGMIEKSILNAVQTRFLILRIFKETLTADSYSGDSIQMLFSQLSGSGKSLDRYPSTPIWVKHIEELLNDCWNESPTLSELSMKLQLNPVTISKHFPKYFGCTYGEYMRRLKIDRSLFLVQDQELPLTEIAMHCGFSDQSHFIRTFKSQTVFLPRQFQKL